MKNVIDALAAAGRNGDTELVHATLGEIVIPTQIQDASPKLMKSIIEAFNETGQDWRKFQIGGIEDKRNPQTGAREYFVGPGAGTSGVGASIGAMGVEAQGEALGLGGGGSSSGPSLESDTGVQPTAEQAAAAGQSVDPGYGFEAPAPAGPSFGDQIESKVKDFFSQPKNVAKTVTTLAPVVGPAVTIGSLLADAARSAGLEVTPSTFSNEEGGEAPGSFAPTSEPGPVVQKPPSYQRPGEVQLPEGLDLSPEMTPLQQRSAIATYGTQGTSSQFRSAPATDYYRNLLQRNLISDNGELAGYDSVLPIEHQYLQQVLGLTYDPTTASLVDALTSTPTTTTLEQIAAA